MNKIKFSKHYTKLDGSKFLFTTVRRYTPEKENYYCSKRGYIFDVEYTHYDFKGIPNTELLVLLFIETEPNKAKLLEVFKVHYGNLSEDFIMYDTEVQS
ncbi:MAG: hypothetical protein V3W20_12610 [Candidatus Neomarinimicrobiota bacterium]